MSDTEASRVRKPVPACDIANCAPPNEDYEYFEGRADNPFKFDAECFEMVNAWWLAEASLLAYADPDFAIPRYREAGFDEVVNFSDDSTQCYAMHNEDFAIVAFSGSDMRHRDDTETLSDIVTDWLVNFDALLVDCEHGGKVHKGFTKALDQVWNPGERPEDERLKPYIDSICEGGRRKVWFTGHSLGAALATISVGRYEHAKELYTFGSPRVGDHEYVESLDCTAYRFVNGNDIVCKVPLSNSSYEHAGEARILGEVSDEDHEQGADESGGLLQRVTDALDSLTTSARERLVDGIPDDYITDHAPIFYAIHIWNDYVGEKP